MAGEKNTQAPTPEELQKKVAELESSLVASGKEKAEAVKTATDLEKKLADVTKVATDLEKQLEAVTGENETLKAVNDQMSKDLASLSEKSMQILVDKAQKEEAPKLSAEKFEVDGQKYGFAFPVMMYKGKRITNADVLASKELQAQLVAAKSGMIKVVD